MIDNQLIIIGFSFLYEEMAAQYFGAVATEHMDGLVSRLDEAGGKTLWTKVREALQQFLDDIRAALNRLAGRDPATEAALRTEEASAAHVLELFDEAVKQTEEIRKARLAEQGERIREEAVRAESGVRSADEEKTYSIKMTRNMDYEEQIRQIEDRKLNGSNSLYIGTAPALTVAGFSDAPFAMNQADFRKARREEGNNKNYSSHSVPLKYFKNLPQKLNDSVIFIDNGIKTTIVTDYKMLDNDGLPSFVVAGVWRDQKMDNDVVNQVKSAYPLDNFTNRLLQAGKDEKLVVTDKNKAEELLASIGVTPAEQSKILGLAKSSITQQTAKSQDASGKIANDSEYDGEKKTYSRKTDNTIEQEAVAHFGTTDNFKTAGYLLQDGQLLDFSGAHWLDGYDEAYIKNWKAKNDIRQVDHEDIFEAYELAGSDFPSDSGLDFMRRGNIRIVPESPRIELSSATEPTTEQYQRQKG